LGAFGCGLSLNDLAAHGQASARYIEYILEKEGDISAVIAEPVPA
jgi:hypothetical protein